MRQYTVWVGRTKNDSFTLCSEYPRASQLRVQTSTQVCSLIVLENYGPQTRDLLTVAAPPSSPTEANGLSCACDNIHPRRLQAAQDRTPVPLSSGVSSSETTQSVRTPFPIAQRSHEHECCVNRRCGVNTKLSRATKLS